MNEYIQAVQRYISANPRQFNLEDMQTISGLLYDSYTELNPIDTEEIREGFGEFDQALRGLTVEENDRVFAVVCRLCSQHEQLAFIEGLRVGAQLMMELFQ